MKSNLSTALVTALLAGSPLFAAITFNTGTAIYNASDLVLVPSANVMASNTTNIFIRDPRATLQTFQVGSAIEVDAINIIVRRAVQGASFTLTLRDFGTTQANSYTAANVAAATTLATSNETVTAGQAFGQASGAISATLDPATTMTWTLPSSVNLVTGRYYGLVVDGISLTAAPLVYQYSLGNAYATGLGYLQDSSSAASGGSTDFNSGGGYFGAGNNQQVDWSLALVAVPEPSTYALLLGMAALGGVLLRRRLRD